MTRRFDVYPPKVLSPVHALRLLCRQTAGGSVVLLRSVIHMYVYIYIERERARAQEREREA